jgi:hypothetical protein
MVARLREAMMRTMLEPTTGLEPVTPCLQDRRSTFELRRRTAHIVTNAAREVRTPLIVDGRIRT